MAEAMELADLKVIDADSHITEPPDLWTSRVPKIMLADVPQVARHPQTGHSHWRIRDSWLLTVGHYARAGWGFYPPSAPKELHEVDPGSWRAADRLQRLDEYGIYGQVLYPNIIGFEAPVFAKMDRALSLACTRAYNDFLIDFSSADAKRFIPIAMVPFWDIDMAVAELERARKTGHKGALFSNMFEQIGYPSFTDPHWDRIYVAAQDLGMSINFHVGFSSYKDGYSETRARKEAAARAAKGGAPDQLVHSPNTDPFAEQFDPRVGAKTSVLTMLQAIDPLVKLLTEGLCERFPKLKFVFVESGFGYVPFLLESLDWHWKGYGAHLKYPALPSEYFRRQCYGSFWFETGTLPLLEAYPDNFMFETDYPHPTGMSPGPASPAENPAAHIARHMSKLPFDVSRKALHDNAAMLYHMDG